MLRPTLLDLRAAALQHVIVSPPWQREIEITRVRTHTPMPFHCRWRTLWLKMALVGTASAAVQPRVMRANRLGATHLRPMNQQHSTERSVSRAWNEAAGQGRVVSRGRKGGARRVHPANHRSPRCLQRKGFHILSWRLDAWQGLGTAAGSIGGVIIVPQALLWLRAHYCGPASFPAAVRTGGVGWGGGAASGWSGRRWLGQPLPGRGARGFGPPQAAEARHQRRRGQHRPAGAGGRGHASRQAAGSAICRCSRGVR